MSINYARFVVEYYDLPDWNDDQVRELRDRIKAALLLLHPEARRTYDVGVHLDTTASTVNETSDAIVDS